MKKQIFSLILALALAPSWLASAQDNPEGALGLPGDNLNLYAVLKVFQESPTLEGFEKALNDENQTINNLDLNYDNQVDYIRVIDNVDGNVHNIVLQVPFNDRENQDVAVITVDRQKDGSVYIQVTGDEDLYGKNYIIEPNYNDTVAGETPNPGYTGNRDNAARETVVITRTTPVEVASWPLIVYIYEPVYVPWHSRWYWGYYPPWWRPWRPFSWHYYYGFHSHWHNHYYGFYRPVHVHRFNVYNNYYYSARRTTSVNVNVNIQQNRYRTTYSHPEDRSRGEADFAKRNPDVATRRNNAGTGGNVSEGRGNTRQNEIAAPESRRSSGSTATGNRPERAATSTGTTRRETSVSRSQTTRETTVDRSQPTRETSVSRSQTTRELSKSSSTGRRSNEASKSSSRSTKSSSATRSSGNSKSKSSSGSSRSKSESQSQSKRR